MRSSTTMVVLASFAALAAACSDGGNDLPPSLGTVGGTSAPGDTSGGATTDSQPGAGGQDTTAIDTVNMPATCGDGILDDNEACDDGNHENGDGCKGDCLEVEEGWSCYPPGKPCHRMVVCGDGAVMTPELCDDGNQVDGDGCSALCQTEVGYKCEGDPSVCTPTTCGDGVAEGAETCDDGNTRPFDGCGVDCQGEPQCPVGQACSSVCGDAIVLGDEECDDGNQVDGDGCSSTCTIEPGFTCTQNTEVGPIMEIPVIYRDFRAGDLTNDFQYPGEKDGDLAWGLETETIGLVQATLGDDKRPVFAKGPAGNDAALRLNGLIHSATTFDTWYRDPADPAATVVSKLLLFDDDGDGAYINRWGSAGQKWTRLGKEYEGNPVFFPLDGLGITPESEYDVARIPPNYFGLPDGSAASDKPCDLDQTGANRCNPCWPIECITGDSWNDGDCAPEGQTVTWYACYPTSPRHNFHFTTEVAYWFQYDAATTYTLSFTGDDDLWVFVNGHLALDLGGIHTAISKTLTISSANAASLGLQDGQVYEIRVFHAERQTYASTFRLTLRGFRASRSVCTPLCGDGIVTIGEECDDGVNAGGYGQCGPNCKLDAYCGDGVVDTEYEDCDDGNLRNGDACPSSCRNIIYL